MNLETTYEVRFMKISDEVGKMGKKGIIPGEFIGEIKYKGMIAPRQVIKVGDKNYTVRCVDLYQNKRIIIVENK